MSLRRKLMVTAGLVSTAGVIVAGSAGAAVQPNPCPPETIYSGGALHINCHTYPILPPVNAAR